MRILLIAAALIAVIGAPLAQPAAPQPGSQAKVIAYYFHITHRCGTCLAIERYAKEAIENGFSQQLREGDEMNVSSSGRR